MKKRIGCALICSAIIVSALTGCGKETTSSTILNEMPLITTTEVPASTVSTEASTEEQTFAEDEVYAGISYVDALAAVRVNAGSGSVLQGARKGALPDGTEAWEISVSPITESAEEITVVYYVHDDFCSPLQ